jgi:hypothetical protein
VRRARGFAEEARRLGARVVDEVEGTECEYASGASFFAESPVGELHTSQLPASQTADLIAYLQTL